MSVFELIPAGIKKAKSFIKPVPPNAKEIVQLKGVKFFCSKCSSYQYLNPVAVLKTGEEVCLPEHSCDGTWLNLGPINSQGCALLQIARTKATVGVIFNEGGKHLTFHLLLKGAREFQVYLFGAYLAVGYKG